MAADSRRLRSLLSTFGLATLGAGAAILIHGLPLRSASAATGAGREVIAAPDAPKAVGPYSQGVKAGNLVFVAGQLPLDPKTSQLVQGGIEEQTKR